MSLNIYLNASVVSSDMKRKIVLLLLWDSLSNLSQSWQYSVSKKCFCLCIGGCQILCEELMLDSKTRIQFILYSVLHLVQSSPVQTYSMQLCCTGTWPTELQSHNHRWKQDWTPRHHQFILYIINCKAGWPRCCLHAHRKLFVDKDTVYSRLFI